MNASSVRRKDEKERGEKKQKKERKEKKTGSKSHADDTVGATESLVSGTEAASSTPSGGGGRWVHVPG